MGKNVFANGREVSGKKDDNKSIAAMADVCLSPPSPPAGPVPIPYPNTAKASDTTDGSKSVKIGGGEVGKKNSSSYKRSNGDEAATRGLGMGVVTHNIQGKMKHVAWSMDVKIEGANAIRHMDMTTHNHMNCPNIALTLNNAGMAEAMPQELTCEELDRLGNPGPDSVAERELEEGCVLQGQTMTLGSYTNPPGAPGGNHLMKGVSHGSMLDDQFANGWSEGKRFTPHATRGENSRACGQGGNYGPNTCGHAEARIVEDVFDGARNTPGVTMPTAAPGLGSLTLNIDWCPGLNNPSAQHYQEPCPACRMMICEAEACGLEIKICVNGEPTDPPCEDGAWTGEEGSPGWAPARPPRPTTAF